MRFLELLGVFKYVLKNFWVISVIYCEVIHKYTFRCPLRIDLSPIIWKLLSSSYFIIHHVRWWYRTIMILIVIEIYLQEG